MFDHLRRLAYNPSPDEADRVRRIRDRFGVTTASSTRTAEGLAFDRNLPPSEALGRIRDAFRAYVEGEA